MARPRLFRAKKKKAESTWYILDGNSKRCVLLVLPGKKGRSQVHRRLHINLYNIMASMILDGERTTGNDVREQNGEL